MTRIFLIISLIISSLSVSAQSIADRLDKRTNVKIAQPAQLRARLVSSKPAETIVAEETEVETVTPSSTTTGGGYRVQVFSDNNPRTAKGEAQSKAAAISEMFPQWATYITYDSPYWRLRVGDFRTYDDATHAVVELKNALPSYRRELRVVRDRIKITD